MAARVTGGIRAAVVLFPLAAALGIGSVVSMATVSWGHAFIPWQLFWWIFVSLVVGSTTHHIAHVVKPDISTGLFDRNLFRLYTVVAILAPWKLPVLLVGFAISIWIMVAGTVQNAPVGSYWLLPLSAFLYAAIGPANVQIAERKRRCSNLTSAQKDAYDAEFLLKLYALGHRSMSKQVSLPEIRSQLKHECTPELLPDTIRRWVDRKCIETTEGDGTQRITLLENGRQICVRAEKNGMETALRDHDECLRLNDTEKAAFRDGLFRQIYELTQSLNAVPKASLRSLQTHRCTLELIDPAFRELSDLGLIDLSKWVYSLNPASKSDRYVRRPAVGLTDLGRTVIKKIDEFGTLDDALNDHNLQVQREDDRHKRCDEATGLQRIEFEYQFLLALYFTTSGDTKEVTLGDVWKRLNHECFKELTPNALRIWLDKKDIRLRRKHFTESGRLRLINKETILSLTADGRDLCTRAIILDSMQEALRERQEGHRVTNKYTISNSQVGAVGPNAKVYDNEFAQFVNATDQYPLDKLAMELAKLRKELLERAASEERTSAEQRTSAEHYRAIGDVAAAEVAASKGDRQGVWQHLAKVGTWVLDIAKEIGVSLAAEAIKTVFKAYNIPI
jgi:hypothetical protein